ncbi:carbamate kinase [Borrelia sp. RT1S]|uniref:carbamate kinase n=1 Tax=Borrelia sp. RT1S TaxID=2898580 RepID=UPI001E5C8ED6|nr:carbamate kinase [Borrelia sp. RT1S]UGQ17619.1 carbamate kinase [Borrelia sp. RT1S]
MDSKKIVICLGGNALEDGNGEATAEKQFEVVMKSITGIVDLIESGHEVVISHGNGPQVGRIVLQNEMAKHETPAMPLDICGAMSQGMIGYHIEQALRNELRKRGVSKDVAVLITQVIVDKEDKGFRDPSKPIGPFYDRATALELEKSKGYVLREDSGRGYRRVVASPMPLEIVEIEAIKELIGKGFIVIACGGGGVPLVRDLRGNIEGVSAVIDKDFASSRLAQDVGADVLIILTAVEKVSLNFGKSDEILLNEVSTSDMEKYIDEGHFAVGSMLPKVQAGMEFVKSSEGRIAIITSLDKLSKDIENARGTVIKD